MEIKLFRISRNIKKALCIFLICMSSFLIIRIFFCAKLPIDAHSGYIHAQLTCFVRTQPIMSINADVRLVDSDRDQQAKEAGHLIYSSIRSDTDSSVVTLPTNSHPARMPPPVPEVRSERYSLGQGRMSTVRRTFCLFVLFDLILTFILWVIYTQLIGLDGYKAFDDQVLHYDFKFSLFDSVMLAVYRFTLLLLAYALFKLQHWWVIAITTATTCAVLIAKIFVFDFQGSKTNNNPLSYCLIIISFVLAWAETWFLDFKVLPQEQKALDRLRLSSAPNYGSIYIPVQASGLRPDDMQSLITEDNQFYSPVESPADSDAEEEPQGVTKGDRTSEYLSAQSSKQPTRQASAVSINSQTIEESEYMKLAKHSWEVLWTYLNSPESDWTVETGVDEMTGVVHSKRVKGVGKVFRLKGIVDLPFKQLYEELTFKPEQQPRWNKALKESRVLQVVDDHTDVLYNIAAEIAGGVITSRDFVSLRSWGQRDGIYLGAGMAVTHPDMPPQKSYVRGTNGVGGWVYKSYQGDPKKTLFFWFMNTDIKGWFPQALIDANMAKVLMDFLNDLRAHVKDMSPSS
ncbi:stAR-related lipid transfer protein 3-like isoform X2 [Biomphalaria glabrata]|uniref:StAR-related lipid transfer protein 3-like isoform X2 n=1 Tax=Biomphalaria glabrata TaxID=6526 RepID=A0A9W2YA14_BIOGL|nr:stAR-related lipid transfer protein 3-like isoform X2 [Biomphalaria glabrata]